MRKSCGDGVNVGWIVWILFGLFECVRLRHCYSWFEFGTSVDMVHLNGVSHWSDFARDIHLAWILGISISASDLVLRLQVALPVNGSEIDEDQD
jgi:hypothetical protein